MSGEITRHDKFYLDDRLAILQVENKLFRLPVRQFIFHSEHFRDMFDCPPGQGNAPEGLSDDNPIKLPVSLTDFVALVGFFNRELCQFNESKEDWLSVLRLAHQYMMERVHKSAYEALSKHSFEPFEKLQIAEKHDIPLEWASDSLHSLWTRADPLTVKESCLLSHPLAAAISYTREKYQQMATQHICERCDTVYALSYDPIVSPRCHSCRSYEFRTVTERDAEASDILDAVQKALETHD